MYEKSRKYSITAIPINYLWILTESLNFWNALVRYDEILQNLSFIVKFDEIVIHLVKRRCKRKANSKKSRHHKNDNIVEWQKRWTMSSLRRKSRERYLACFLVHLFGLMGLLTPASKKASRLFAKIGTDTAENGSPKGCPGTWKNET